MVIRNYVGARYVPKFADPVEWQANTSYEAMVIVTYNNSSYTSKIPVPPTVGNPAENSKYWVLTGNYNAQVEEYRKATVNHINDKSNPHNVTKSQIGLTNVSNYDQSKAIKSITRNGTTFTATALDGSTTTFNQQGNEYVTPEMFGAKGDGVTDDTKAFQDCFDYVSNNLVAIILSGKKYILNSPVFIKSTVFLYGNGSRIIAPNGGFICTDYSPESRISDIFITSNNEEYFNLSNPIYGLYLGGGHLKLNNVTVSYFTYGIYITSKFRNINQTGCFITNCHIRYTDYALYVNDTGNYATDYTIDTCTLAGRKFGLYTDCGIGYIISNVHTWGGLEIALYIVNANLCQISNCYFETCSLYGIDLLNCRSGNVITNINYITDGSNSPFIWIAGKTQAPNSQRILLNNIYIDNRKNASELKAVLISGDGNGRVVSCSNINSANDFLLLKNGASNTKVFIDGTNISNNNLVIHGNNVSSGGYGVTLHSDSKEIRLPYYKGVSFNVEFFICSRDNSNSITSFNYVQAFFTAGDGSSLYHSNVDMSNAGINYETRFDTNSNEIVLSFTSSLSNYISINARPTLYVPRV